MNLVFLGLGANLGNRFDTIQAAIHHLSSHPHIQLIKRSRLCESIAENGHPQPKYLNGVIEITTSLSAEALLIFTQEIEQKLGRTSKSDDAPRTIDIDLLFFNDTIIETPSLTVPHPRIRHRLFVLGPLMEIAPNLIIPGTPDTVSDCYRALVSPPEFLIPPTAVSQAHLAAFAGLVAPLIHPGTIVRLFGEMGAGKTTFTRELVRCLGSLDLVSSPTFTLVNVYTGPIRICHLDLYRIEDENALDSLDLERYLNHPHTILLIEWPEKLSDYWHTFPGLTIHIQPIDDTTRKFSVK